MRVNPGALVHNFKTPPQYNTDEEDTKERINETPYLTDDANFVTASNQTTNTHNKRQHTNKYLASNRQTVLKNYHLYSRTATKAVTPQIARDLKRHLIGCSVGVHPLDRYAPTILSNIPLLLKKHI